LHRQESAEVAHERRNNIQGDEVADLRHYGNNRPALDYIGGTLSERYLEGRGALHVHFRICFSGAIVPSNYCAAFNRAPDGLKARNPTGVTGIEGDGVGHGLRRNGGQPMLVIVRQPAENPQSAVSVPSLVWLQPLDECLRALMHAPYHAPTFASEVATIGEDRESRIPLHTSGELSPLVGEGEFVGEVIENNTEVMYNIPDDKGELDGGWIDDFSVDDIAATLQVELSPHSARVAFLPDLLFSFQALQVLTCPI
jgi:hypothetical protein